MDIISFDDRARRIIDEGNILALPTETVYGLGVRWDSQVAYEKLCAAKKRRPSKPIAVMCGRHFVLEDWLNVSPIARKVIDHFLPGPLTILLKAKKNVPFQAHLGTGIVGLRMPMKTDLLEFLDSLPYPLQVTSANLSGFPATGDMDKVISDFDGLDDVRAIVSGKCISNIPTTVVDMTSDRPVLIRQGEISLDDIKKSIMN